MKKDISKRVLCMVCCLSLTLGMFAYRPPEAKAVFASPAVALGVSLVASVMVATTAELVVSTGLADTIGYAINDLVNGYVSSWGAAAVDTAEAFFGEIAGGASLLEDGAIQLSETAGNLMAGFINWLQSEKGLDAGGESLSFGESLDGFISVGGYTIPALPNVDTSKYPYLYIYKTPYSVSSGNAEFRFYASSEPVYRYTESSSYPGNYNFFVLNMYTSRVWYECNTGDTAWTFGAEGADRGRDMGLGVPIYANTAIYEYENQSVLWSDVIPFYPSYVEGTQYSLTPNATFRDIPNEIPEASYLTVNPAINGLDLSDQQSAADAILNGLLAGTLSPTVSIEAQATDVPGTDTDEDDVIAVPGADANLLDWTKYIGQKVAAIPQAISSAVAQAVAGVFAPDPVLVNDITGAFSQKFGFVEDLKQIGDDLFGMTPSSEPPVVWIHLENAEGKYNYGGTVKALDMSWFQRYKADVDRITGGFLWVAYLWLLFRRAPDILGGAGMVVAEGQYISEGTYVDGDTGEVTGHFTYRRSKRH